MHSSSHAAEAERRWGDTTAFRQSRQRAAGYTAADWTRIKTAADDIETRLAAAMRAGWAAASTVAMDLAEEHRRHLARWFYDCPAQLHRALADMYVADDRFAQHYEDKGRGLAAYLRSAIHANADRLAD